MDETNDETIYFRLNILLFVANIFLKLENKRKVTLDTEVNINGLNIGQLQSSVMLTITE